MNIDRFKSHKAGRLVETWYEDKPCLAFVPHPLPPDVPLNDSELMLVLSEADRSLGELAGLGNAIPNPGLLINPLIHREAVASSRIEGTHTGVEELYAYEAEQLLLAGTENHPSNADAQEVLNYVRALTYGIDKQKNGPINLELIREMHGILMKGVRGERSRPGQFRTVQNWIGGRSIRSARFVPPSVPEMRTALDAFEKYVLSPGELPPLINLALLHYQFEAIHPFGDGNGRAGRLLISLLLVHWNLLPLPLLHLSSFFEKHQDHYYDALLAVTEQGAWRDWVLFLLEGMAEQAKDTIRRAMQLQELRSKWRDTLIALRYPSATLRLVDALFEWPVITISEARALLGLKTYNAAKVNISKLEDLHILEQVPGRKYDKVYRATPILDIVTRE